MTDNPDRPQPPGLGYRLKRALSCTLEPPHQGSHTSQQWLGGHLAGAGDDAKLHRRASESLALDQLSLAGHLLATWACRFAWQGLSSHSAHSRNRTYPRPSILQCHARHHQPIRSEETTDYRNAQGLGFTWIHPASFRVGLVGPRVRGRALLHHSALPWLRKFSPAASVREKSSSTRAPRT